MRYSPRGLVWTVREKLVPMLVAVTEAAGTEAPLASETVPRMVEVVSWAFAGMAMRRQAKAKFATERWDMEPLYFF